MIQEGIKNISAFLGTSCHVDIICIVLLLDARGRQRQFFHVKPIVAIVTINPSIRVSVQWSLPSGLPRILLVT